MLCTGVTWWVDGKKLSFRSSTNLYAQSLLICSKWKTIKAWIQRLEVLSSLRTDERLLNYDRSFKKMATSRSTNRRMDPCPQSFQEKYPGCTQSVEKENKPRTKIWWTVVLGRQNLFLVKVISISWEMFWVCLAFHTPIRWYILRNAEDSIAEESLLWGRKD